MDKCCAACGARITRYIRPQEEGHKNHFCNDRCKNRYYDDRRRGYSVAHSYNNYKLISGPDDVQDFIENELTIPINQVNIGLRTGIFPPGCKFVAEGQVYIATANGLVIDG